MVVGQVQSDMPSNHPSPQQTECLSNVKRFSSSVTKLKIKSGSQGTIKDDEGETKLKNQKRKSMQVTDQNTASTVPETLSGLSATTPSTSNTDDIETHVRREKYGFKYATMSKSKTKYFDIVADCSNGDSSVSSCGEDKHGRLTKNGRKATSPLLKTLIGTVDISSAKSSVASSLQEYREDDVGYHLFKMCEKLLDDMNTFMDGLASGIKCEAT